MIFSLIFAVEVKFNRSFALISFVEDQNFSGSIKLGARLNPCLEIFKSLFGIHLEISTQKDFYKKFLSFKPSSIQGELAPTSFFLKASFIPQLQVFGGFLPIQGSLQSIASSSGYLQAMGLKGNLFGFDYESYFGNLDEVLTPNLFLRKSQESNFNFIHLSIDRIFSWFKFGIHYSLKKNSYIGSRVSVLTPDSFLKWITIEFGAEFQSNFNFNVFSFAFINSKFHFKYPITLKTNFGFKDSSFLLPVQTEYDRYFLVTQISIQNELLSQFFEFSFYGNNLFKFEVGIRFQV